MPPEPAHESTSVLDREGSAVTTIKLVSALAVEPSPLPEEKEKEILRAGVEAKEFAAAAAAVMVTAKKKSYDLCNVVDNVEPARTLPLILPLEKKSQSHTANGPHVEDENAIASVTNFKSISSPVKMTTTSTTSTKSLKCRPLADPDEADSDVAFPGFHDDDDDDDESSSSAPRPRKNAKTTTKTTTTTADGAATVDASSLSTAEAMCGGPTVTSAAATESSVSSSKTTTTRTGRQTRSSTEAAAATASSSATPPNVGPQATIANTHATKKNVASKATVKKKEKVKNKLSNKLRHLKPPPGEVVAAQPKNISTVADGHVCGAFTAKTTTTTVKPATNISKADKVPLRMVATAAVADDEALVAMTAEDSPSSRYGCKLTAAKSSLNSFPHRGRPKGSAKEKVRKSDAHKQELKPSLQKAVQNLKRPAINEKEMGGESDMSFNVSSSSSSVSNGEMEKKAGPKRKGFSWHCGQCPGCLQEDCGLCKQCKRLGASNGRCAFRPCQNFPYGKATWLSLYDSARAVCKATRDVATNTSPWDGVFHEVYGKISRSVSSPISSEAKSDASGFTPLAIGERVYCQWQENEVSICNDLCF